MEQRLTLITLGVADYDRAKAFYEALGWQVAMDVDETAFFETNGVVVTPVVAREARRRHGHPGRRRTLGRYRPRAQRPLARGGATT